MGEDALFDMARGRALLTENERKQIAGEQGDQRKYEAISRVRARIREKLTKDMELFEEHKPELLEELREAVCKDKERNGRLWESID